VIARPCPPKNVRKFGVAPSASILFTTVSGFVRFNAFTAATRTAKIYLVNRNGFSSDTVWLVFSAFMFALGYERTGLGRRIALVMVKALGKNTLTLGYATTLTDTILAPFTPSNTARSAGTIFPVVRNLPPLYGSQPNDPSARKIGGYLMWVTFAAGCVTSSLFMTACAPNLLALEFIRKISKVDITWKQWFFASAPFALPLLLALPILTYLLYPPQIKRGTEVPVWAASELEKMGRPSRRELILAVLALLAIVLWISGGKYIHVAMVALLVVSLMLVTRVVTWKEMASNHAAWTTLVLLATLVTLAGGLARVGFIKWFADSVAAHLGGLSPTLAIIALVTVYFFSHYMFASLTAHTTAMMPVLLAVGAGIPGAPEISGLERRVVRRAAAQRFAGRNEFSGFAAGGQERRFGQHDALGA